MPSEKKVVSEGELLPFKSRCENVNIILTHTIKSPTWSFCKSLHHLRDYKLLEDSSPKVMVFFVFFLCCLNLGLGLVLFGFL